MRALIAIILATSALWLSVKTCPAQQGFPDLTLPSQAPAQNVREIPNLSQRSSPTAMETPSLREIPSLQNEQTPAVSEVGRPPPLRTQQGCDLWRGSFSGNDPSVLVEARLCTDSTGDVVGVVQWSSLKSGYNLREVSGTRGPSAELNLHDVAFQAYHPMYLWRFCLIDHYSLTFEQPDHLTGRYESQACADYAQVDLIRVSGSSGSLAK
jgi:hypothetical protein